MELDERSAQDVDCACVKEELECAIHKYMSEFYLLDATTDLLYCNEPNKQRFNRYI